MQLQDTYINYLQYMNNLIESQQEIVDALIANVPTTKAMQESMNRNIRMSQNGFVKLVDGQQLWIKSARKLRFEDIKDLMEGNAESEGAHKASDLLRPLTETMDWIKKTDGEIRAVVAANPEIPEDYLKEYDVLVEQENVVVKELLLSFDQPESAVAAGNEEKGNVLKVDFKTGKRSK